MKLTTFLFSAMALLMISCGAPVTEVIIPEKEPEAVIEVDQTATTCTTLADLDPAIRSETEDAFTLYRDQIRFKNYPEAKGLWRMAYYRAPGANGKATYHFDDGIKIYHYLFENETDDSKKQGLVDTILSVYDKRVECFGDDDGKMKARKAFNRYYSYAPYVNDDETFQLFKEVIEEKGLEAEYFTINPFSKMLYDRVYDEEIDLAEGSRLALKVFDIVEHGLAECEDEYCTAWNVINEYSPPLLSSLEGFRGFYPCAYFTKNYYDGFTPDTSNCDEVDEVYLKMIWGGCDINDPKFDQLRQAKKDCAPPPPPPGPCKEAYTLLQAGEFRAAIEKYKECADTKTDPVKKGEVEFIIAKIYYAHIRNFPEARRWARKAAENKPNWGEPFMMIGKLYASSGPLCGPGTGWDSQVVTWAAIDKFNYAMKVDRTVSAEANKWIKRYSKYMPTKEDIFFRQLKEGDPYFVPCWIQEWTTVRTSD